MVRFLFAEADTGGSLPPELAVMKQVLEAGHDVSVIGDPTMAAEVEAIGVTDFRPWSTAPHRVSRRAEDDFLRDWEARTKAGQFQRLLDRLMLGPAAAFAADVGAAIEKTRPDVVVTSFPLFGAQMAAEQRGVPWVVLAPGASLMPVKGMPPPGMLPGTGPAGRLRDRMFLVLARAGTRRWLPALNSVRRSLGLEPLRGLFQQYDRADRVLKLTARSFDLPAEVAPNVRYVGPQLDDPGWAEPWTPPEDDGRPFVLVSLSTMFLSQAALLGRIIEALGTLPVRALVTTGPAIDPEQFEVPPNVTLARSAPHSQVLPHTDVLVTHGGHGTVIKALAAGVPIVCMPFGRDQPDVATRLRYHGAGIEVSRDASVRKIAAGVRKVLDDPSYAASATAIGQRIMAEIGTGAAVDELEAVARGSSSPEQGTD